MRLLPCLLITSAIASCGDSAPSTELPQARSAGEHYPATDERSETETGQAEVAGVELASSPSLNFADNRYLWHLYTDGLLLPLASEGIRKYNHEYARPWKGNVEIAGTTGRVLARRQSVLRFAWFDVVPSGESALRIRVNGLVAGQKLSVSLNGKLVANVKMTAEWQTIQLPVPSGVLRKGENELKLHVGKAGRAGPNTSYGLWHSIVVLGPGHTPEPSENIAQVLQPASGGDNAELSGFQRMVQLVEIPDAAWLEFGTAGAGAFEIRITDSTGGVHSVFSQEGPTTAVSRISLAQFSNQLVRLELMTPGDGRWLAPRIALESSGVAPKPASAKNVILLVVDALRSDHVPLYGSIYGKSAAVSMPNTEALAAAGSVVFLNNQAASPSSPPSHGSIQTGMIPRVHGVDGDRGKLRAGTPMISTQAVSAGIAAGYFGNNPFGMGRLEEPGQWTEFHQPGQEGKSNDCRTLMPMMLDFSKQQSSAGKRFFISSLPYETHTPYRYHEGISNNYYKGPWTPPLGKKVGGESLSAIANGSMTLSKQQWKQLKGLYRGEAEYWDQCFGMLVKGLREAKLLDDTAIVLTSDHGEGMFEHGRMGHAFGHYRELGDVPFVIFWPALAGPPGSGVRNIETVTSHRDIAPTVLDILGIDASPKVQGQSVLPLALRVGGWTERVVSLEYGRSYSLRSRRYKLIADYNGQQEFFDLGEDPWEARDVKDGGADAVRYLRDMAGFFLEYRSDWHYRDWGTLNNHGEGLLKAARKRSEPAQ